MSKVRALWLVPDKNLNRTVAIQSSNSSQYGIDWNSVSRLCCTVKIPNISSSSIFWLRNEKIVQKFIKMRKLKIVGKKLNENFGDFLLTHWATSFNCRPKKWSKLQIFKIGTFFSPTSYEWKWHPSNPKIKFNIKGKNWKVSNINFLFINPRNLFLILM